jgi:hypothetical protein
MTIFEVASAGCTRCRQLDGSAISAYCVGREDIVARLRSRVAAVTSVRECWLWPNGLNASDAASYLNVAYPIHWCSRIARVLHHDRDVAQLSGPS